MRTFISTLLVTSIVLVPSLALAQTTGPSVTPPATATHPNVAPPTKVPTKPLPPAQLPNGKMIAPSETGTSAAGSVEPLAPTSLGGATLAAILIGGVAILIVGAGWYARRRKGMGL